MLIKQPRGLPPNHRVAEANSVVGIFEVLAVLAAFSGGLRLFGERFLDQFVVAVLFSAFFSSMAYIDQYGERPEAWRVAIFASSAVFMSIGCYWLDKRFKFTHWEKNPD
jgi:uncharacterized membrane protein